MIRQIGSKMFKANTDPKQPAMPCADCLVVLTQPMRFGGAQADSVDIPPKAKDLT
jgi:hypothetical protein